MLDDSRLSAPHTACPKDDSEDLASEDLAPTAPEYHVYWDLPRAWWGRLVGVEPHADLLVEDGLALLQERLKAFHCVGASERGVDGGAFVGQRLF